MKKIIVTLFGIIVTAIAYCQEKFPIVANNTVVGYTTEQPSGDMPDALKEMLESCGGQSASTRGDNFPEWYTPRDVEPIKPLITTHWSQCSPYNDLTSKKLGICVVIAYAQLANYYKIGGIHKGFYCEGLDISLPPTTFDYDLILDYYGYWSSEESKHEVARFIQYYECVFYSSQLYKDVLDFKVCRYAKDALTATSFSEYYDGIVYSTHEFLDSCLSHSIPVIGMGANSDEEGHMFIIDGRDSDGLYHINWGWGGYYDGYFAICDTFDDFRTTSMFNVSLFITYDIDGWTPTSIKPVRYNTSNAVYNLHGNKVGDSLDGLPSGIYVMNGKKHIVR